MKRNINRKRLKIFTWHVHGTYLQYLTQTGHDFYLPVKTPSEEGYGGRTGPFKWGTNVHEVPDTLAKELDVDLVLFQSHRNFLVDQYEVLSHSQRRLPRVFLEHDPPRRHPTDTPHPATADKLTTIVHVTEFNRQMWNNGDNSTTVVEHGIKTPASVHYTGEVNKGVVVVNNLLSRGRRLGLDLFLQAREKVPLDLVGMNSDKLGGLGEVQYPDLPAFISRYRFFFYPVRYTSLGMALCEAMAVGLPTVAFASTQVPLVINNGVNGFTALHGDELIFRMKQLLRDKKLAFALSTKAVQTARKRFSLERFKNEWNEVFQQTVNRISHPIFPDYQHVYQRSLI